MRRALAVAVLLALLGRPAAAWSEDAGEWEPEPPEIEVPVREIEVPVREVEVPVREVEVPVREERLMEREIPEGVYLVTETYVRDVVTIEGPLTTYETETVAWSPGSYARELETVGTGTASALDGAAFNGRLALSDGRPVAGTFYENLAPAIQRKPAGSRTRRSRGALASDRSGSRDRPAGRGGTRRDRWLECPRSEIAKELERCQARSTRRRSSA